MKCILFSDGGSRGNPGPAAAGVVLKNESGEVIKEMGMYLGKCTNNEAEYRALVLGLDLAKRLGCSGLDCYLDSELVVRQLNGQYRVKDANLKTFYDKVKILELELGVVSYHHVLRTKNKESDALVNEVLDAEEKK